MQIIAVPIDSIKLHPDNCRVHGDANLDLIKKSLLEFKQYKPLVVQKSSNFIIAGNGTYMAAKQLGWTELDCVFFDIDDDRARCLAIADNRTSDLSEWNFSNLLECTNTILDEEWQESMQFDRKFIRKMERMVNKPPPKVKPVVSDEAIKIKKRRITCPNCGKTYEK